MNEFNTYLNNLDYSFIKDLCERKGKVHTYRKGDFFIRQNEKKAFCGMGGRWYLSIYPH